MRLYLLLVLSLSQNVYDKWAFAQVSINLRKFFFQPTDELLPSCQSKIYCNSELLHDVQMSCVYPNGGTFLSKTMRYSESEILEKYDRLKQNIKNDIPSNDELAKFIDDNFEDGNELEDWTPTDFTENPSIVNRIRDKNYKEWAHALNHVWTVLAKKIKVDVKIHPDKYSLLWIPNGFIIPGGVFKELYYWDTYWIINGLLLCDMRTTARGIIENIISLVNQFGFMPNGSRVFYLNRSQPPLLILMALSYYKATNDFDFIKTNIANFEIELQFWLENRMITFKKDGKKYKMARYISRSIGPRPESYLNDFKLAEKYTETDKNDLYTKIKSAAESGWVFSSRWFITSNGTNLGNLSDIQTSNVVPVDLNSFLHVNALTLSKWFNQMGNKKKANKYKMIGKKFLKSIQEVMWRPDKGAWFDWDLIYHKHREYFYVSNIVPLWTGSYSFTKKSAANAVLKYLRDQHILELDFSVKYNGTPTSMYLSSQQWDFPNAWSPLQAFIIQGLDRTQQKRAQHVAAKMADVWLRSNYEGFTTKSMMFEKYSVLAEGKPGVGGEYSHQTGFGWTNGVVLEFLDRWGELASYIEK